MTNVRPAAIPFLSLLGFALTMLVLPGPAPAETTGGAAPGGDQAWCEGLCKGDGSCAAMCMKAPFRKMTFTEQSIPIGTPVTIT